MGKAKAPTVPPQALAVIGHDRNTVGQLFRDIAPRLGKLLPGKVDADRLLQIALSELMTTPSLSQCTRASFLGALFQCAKLNLQLGVRGQAYLIPRRTGPYDPAGGGKSHEAHFQIGYQGLLDLARRSGQIEKVEARVVRKGDDFSYAYGTEPFIRHTPQREAGEGELIAAYAVGWIKGARAPQFEVMEAWEIENIKTFVRAEKQGDRSAWKGPFAAGMWRKSPLIRLCKLLPASVEMQQAVALDELTTAGKSQGLASEVEVSLDLGPGEMTEPTSAVEQLLGPESQPEPQTVDDSQDNTKGTDHGGP